MRIWGCILEMGSTSHTSQQQKHRIKEKTKHDEKFIPAIPIAWVLIYADENDENPQLIRDMWEIWGILTALQKDFVSRIELRFEEVDKGFGVSVFLNPVPLKTAFDAGVKKGEEIAFQRSNKIGFVEEDVEGLVWLSR